MKTAAQATPNHRLRQARESRGWSQEYLAEQIGVTAFTVGRWERGVTLPTPHYRRKLSEVLLLSVRQLGLVASPDRPHEERAELDGSTIAASISLSTNAGRSGATVPPLPPHTLPLIGRNHLHAQISAALCDETLSAPVTLYGLPGAGKTTLAGAIAHDPVIRQQFADGIIWCGLGPEPGLRTHLLSLGMAVGVAQEELATCKTVEALAKIIYAAIDSRRFLLVLDDVWRLEDALALCVGGPQCAYLVTTRFPELAFQLSRDHAIMTPELTLESALELLQRLAPDAVSQEPEAARKLVYAVGALPLALTLIGDYLYVQTRSNQPRRLHAALALLANAEQRLQLAQPRSPLHQSPSLPAGGTLSLQAAIAVSAQSLNAPAHEALSALALFPAKPNSFSESAALDVANCAEDTLDVLARAGLLESNAPGRYSLHQTIADYARMQMSGDTVQRRNDGTEVFPALTPAEARYIAWAVTYARERASDHTAYESLEGELANLLGALALAGAPGDEKSLIEGTLALAPFFEVRGFQASAHELLARAYQAAQWLGDTARSAQLLVHLGRATAAAGDCKRAAELYAQGLVFAEQVNDLPATIRLLAYQGDALTQLGRYREATPLLERGLSLATMHCQHALLPMLLRLLGEAADCEGRNIEAYSFYLRGLRFARQQGDHETTCALLQIIGGKATVAGDFHRGERYLREGVQLARLSGYRQRLSALVNNLGITLTGRGVSPRPRSAYKKAC